MKLETRRRGVKPRSLATLLVSTAQSRGQWHSNGVGRVGKLQGAPDCRDPSSGQKNNNNFHVKVKIATSGYQTLECFVATLPSPKCVLCTWVKLLTDLQTLGFELHKNAFGGRAPPRPAGELQRSPRPSSRYKGEEREERRRKGLEIGRARKGREGKDEG